MVQLQHTLTCTLVLMIGRRDCESTGEVQWFVAAGVSPPLQLSIDGLR